MNAANSPKNNFPTLLLIGSAAANTYFWLQVLVYVLHVKGVLIGVFTELLTIPCILGLIVCECLLILFFFQGKLNRAQKLGTVLLLASTTALVVGAFSAG